MSYASGSKKNKAMIFFAYTSGLRSLLYKDIKEELEKEYEVISVPVYSEMKKVDPAACKENIIYCMFMSKEAVQAL